MDWLWSPWRYRYVNHLPEVGECIFCDKGKLPLTKQRIRKISSCIAASIATRS